MIFKRIRFLYSMRVCFGASVSVRFEWLRLSDGSIQIIAFNITSASTMRFESCGRGKICLRVHRCMNVGVNIMMMKLT